MFDDKYNSRALTGEVGIMEGLPQTFGPFPRKIEFDGVARCKAVDAGAVLETNLHFPVITFAPGLLVFALFVEMFGVSGNGE